MAHPLDGKWQIEAESPIGKLDMVATMQVAENQEDFTGTVYVEKLKAECPLTNGKVNGNSISYCVAMKFGIIPMKFNLEGTFNDKDWTCEGVARAFKMECKYTGKKI